MFTQAQRVGTDRLVLLYAVQGHYEWIDDDEIDTESVRRRCDDEALDQQSYYDAGGRACRGSSWVRAAIW